MTIELTQRAELLELVALGYAVKRGEQWTQFRPTQIQDGSVMEWRLVLRPTGFVVEHGPRAGARAAAKSDQSIVGRDIANLTKRRKGFQESYNKAVANMEAVIGVGQKAGWKRQADAYAVTLERIDAEIAEKESQAVVLTEFPPVRSWAFPDDPSRVSLTVPDTAAEETELKEAVRPSPKPKKAKRA